tara:strand:- start:381 stop:524 length:144 start_codon:yes stop_codon:yes gene_type:complete
MGRIADQFAELIKRMEESDRRLQELIEKHLDDTQAHLNDLRRINEEL